jgi:transcription termination/antitermination protein NusA
MPAIQRSEFALALNQVAAERGIDVSVILETVKNAILAAYRKDHPSEELIEYEVFLDANTGEAKILDKGKDITPPGFGRIAAQTAKQVILQKIREKEKEAIMSDYKHRVGTVVNGMVLRFAGPNILIDIGKTEGIMSPADQIQNEKYYLNQRLSVYIVEIREGLKGEEIVVSRAHTGLLEGLLKREVPEVAQGSVEIKAIAREAGNRSKIAVVSNQSGIDPVGSCVGQKGVRIQAIIQEFNGLEKIDVIQWQDNAKNYIAQALSPAKDLKVEVNEEEKTAKVLVAETELSLAIGKEGQNVRLASKLTGYRIEIEGKPAEIVEEPKKEEKKETKKEKSKKEKPVSEEVESVEAVESVQADEVALKPEVAEEKVEVTEESPASDKEQKTEEVKEDNVGS